jgi:hypothetical protein
MENEVIRIELGVTIKKETVNENYVIDTKNKLKAVTEIAKEAEVHFKDRNAKLEFYFGPDSHYTHFSITKYFDNAKRVNRYLVELYPASLDGLSRTIKRRDFTFVGKSKYYPAITMATKKMEVVFDLPTEDKSVHDAVVIVRVGSGIEYAKCRPKPSPKAQIVTLMDYHNTQSLAESFLHYAKEYQKKVNDAHFISIRSVKKENDFPFMRSEQVREFLNEKKVSRTVDYVWDGSDWMAYYAESGENVI